MKVIILMLGMLLSVSSFSQQQNNTIFEEGIYKTDTDYTNHHLLLAFNNKDEHHFKMKDPLFKHELLIDAPDTTYKFYYDEIWGYRDKNNDYRIFDNKAYQVVYVGKVCIYTITDITPKVNSTVEYFSADLTSPIYEISRNNLIEVYRADTAFVNKIRQLPLTKSIFKWDHKHNMYQFVSWLQ